MNKAILLLLLIASSYSLVAQSVVVDKKITNWCLELDSTVKIQLIMIHTQDSLRLELEKDKEELQKIVENDKVIIKNDSTNIDLEKTKTKVLVSENNQLKKDNKKLSTGGKILKGLSVAALLVGAWIGSNF